MAITYTPTTNFGAKDSLPTNDPDKVIKGSEFTTEFTAIQTAFGLAAPAASPTFTGTVTIGSVDINGGAIDGTIIGGATPAAGSFTTVSATGNITVGGTVDGRDVAADGTKLDGVEAGADVTDTVNVTAAGALMDSELTDIAAVKALNQGVATTDSPSFAGLTATGSVSLAGASTSANITFGDNDKAVFGAGADLEIFSDGTNGRISLNAASGNLRMLADEFQLANTGYTNFYLTTTAADAVLLYHGGNQKLETTATGINVTGTVTADGLTVDGAGTAVFSGGQYIQVDGDAAGVTDLEPVLWARSKVGASIPQINVKGSQWQFGGGGTLDANPAMTIDYANGDISFYEDTGTTAKFFWDASAESLMLNATSRIASETLTVNGTVTTGGGTAAAPALAFRADSNTGIFRPAAQSIGFSANGSEAMRINSSGNVGIGTTSPERLLHINSAAAQIGALIQSTSTLSARLSLANADTTNTAKVGIGAIADDLALYAGGAQRVTVEDSGNVGIGTDSPSSYPIASDLVVDTSTNGGITIKSGTSNYGGVFFADGTTGNEQYRGFVQYNHDYAGSTDSLLFGTSGAERLRIDSAGNVGIGTSSPTAKLHILADTPVLMNNAAGTSEGKFDFVDSGATLRMHNFFGTGSNITFLTNPNGGAVTERMRLDSSGNLLVGKTSTALADVGHNFSPSGFSFHTRDGGAVAYFNRETSDGDIAVFYKDGTTVGSVGSANGDLFVGTGDTGLRFHDGDNRIYPINTSGAAKVDATIDLGDPTGRFKDLYLSGGVYLGGTGAANLLDDYEEGTWTPVSGTNSTVNSVGSAFYTKVGRQVTVYAYITSLDIATVSVSLGGLPFTAASGYGPATAYYGTGAASVFAGNSYVELSSTIINLTFSSTFTGAAVMVSATYFT